MAMPVVNVRVMGMAMRKRLVDVVMDMRLTAIPGGIVRVLVVDIVRVAVAMRQGLMAVGMGMALGQVQP